MVPDDSDDMDEAVLGYIASSETAVLQRPVFIIEQNGVYYVAVAVLEYNEDDADEPEEKQGCAAVRRLHESAGRHSRAAPYEGGWDRIAMVNTKPPRQKKKTPKGPKKPNL